VTPNGRFGFRMPAMARDPLLPKFPYRLWGSHILLFGGYRGSFPQVKRPGREVNNKPPSSTEVKIWWSCTSALPIYLHGVEGNISPFLALMLLYMRV
jgi:hypothetical protein